MNMVQLGTVVLENQSQLVLSQDFKFLSIYCSLM